MQFAEKRIVRDIPPPIQSRAHFPFFGLGGDTWAESARLVASGGFLARCLAWLSESGATCLPQEGTDISEGGARAVWIFTYPTHPTDIASLVRSISSHPPQVVVFDVQPQRALASELQTALESTPTGWHCAVNSPLLWGTARNNSHRSPTSPLL